MRCQLVQTTTPLPMLCCLPGSPIPIWFTWKINAFNPLKLSSNVSSLKPSLTLANMHVARSGEKSSLLGGSLYCNLLFEFSEGEICYL